MHLPFVPDFAWTNKSFVLPQPWEHFRPNKGRRSGRAAFVFTRSQSAIGDGKGQLATDDTTQADDDDMGGS